MTPADFFASLALSNAEGSVAAVAFGPESQGLSAEEFGLCHVWLRIPAQDRFPSLNVAQAVLVTLYECVLCQRTPSAPADAPESVSTAAGIGAQEAFLARCESRLMEADLAPDSRALTQLRRLLHRAAPTPGDLALLETLLRATLKRGSASMEAADLPPDTPRLGHPGTAGVPPA